MSSNLRNNSCLVLIDARQNFTAHFREETFGEEYGKVNHINAIKSIVGEESGFVAVSFPIEFITANVDYEAYLRNNIMSDEEVNKCLSSIRAEQSETSNDSSNTKEVKKPKIKIFIYSYIVCSTKENGDKLIVEDFDQFAEKAIESFVDPSDELSVGKTLELLKKQVNASRELTKEEEKK